MMPDPRRKSAAVDRLARIVAAMDSAAAAAEAFGISRHYAMDLRAREAGRRAAKAARRPGASAAPAGAPAAREAKP